MTAPSLLGFGRDVPLPHLGLKSETSRRGRHSPLTEGSVCTSHNSGMAWGCAAPDGEPQFAGGWSALLWVCFGGQQQLVSCMDSINSGRCWCGIWPVSCSMCIMTRYVSNAAWPHLRVRSARSSDKNMSSPTQAGGMWINLRNKRVRHARLPTPTPHVGLSPCPQPGQMPHVLQPPPSACSTNPRPSVQTPRSPRKCTSCAPTPPPLPKTPPPQKNPPNKKKNKTSGAHRLCSSQARWRWTHTPACLGWSRWPS